eukprot:COSAG06_NODE_24523_length_660_cov_0.862745_2_plen_47_part_01
MEFTPPAPGWSGGRWLSVLFRKHSGPSRGSWMLKPFASLGSVSVFWH